MAQSPDGLEATVLKWSLGNIADPTFLATKVGTVPMEFSSTKAYQQAFRVPLLEDFRAQLHQALESSITMGPVLPVDITCKKKNKENDSEKYAKMIFHLKSSSWSRNTSESPIKGSEIILLCSYELGWDSTRECVVIPAHNKFRCILASAITTSDGQTKATAYVQTADLDFIQRSIRDEKLSWCAFRMGMSFIAAQRTWDALDKVIRPVNKVPPLLPVLQSILQIKQTSSPEGIKSLHLPQEPEGARTLKDVKAYCTSIGLNPSQAEALRSVVAGLLTIEPNLVQGVRLVQGPPGTGKTSMLVSLLSVLGCLHRRTLVSAPTNAAVVEIITRMMTDFFQDEKGEQKKLFSKYCTENLHLQSTSRIKAIREWSPLELREIVLVGSLERLKGAVDGTLLTKVFLPYRVDRLLAALRGWKASLDSLREFMKDAPRAFGTTIKGQKNWSNQIPNAPFWKFAGQVMNGLKNKLEESSSVLLSELPRCQLDERTGNAITKASDLMKELVASMPSEAPKGAVSWFTASKTDILVETFSAINLVGLGRKGILKSRFIGIKETLLEILISNPDFYLFQTKKHPKGCQLDEDWLESLCLSEATLVFSTVSSAGRKQMRRIPFECGIVDEASQLVEAETTIITSISELKQLILVGDHKQLPATVISKVAEKCGYGRSLFDRLQTLGHGCRHLLNIQYRMHPAISLFSNYQFYNGAVKDGPNVLSADYGRSLYPLLQYGPYAFLDCKHGVEVSEKKSWTNPMEVQLVTNLVKRLANVCARGRSLKTISVGIISPYAMQAQALEKSLKHLNVNANAIDIQVKTVDGFQGGEKDVIIFSAVRANHIPHGIGFVKDCRRLNVAITRGRYSVWIVGNAKTLERGARVWKDLISDAKSRNCFHSAAVTAN